MLRNVLVIVSCFICFNAYARFEVEILDRNPREDLAPANWSMDLDKDGVIDTVNITAERDVVISLGNGNELLYSVPEGMDVGLHDIDLEVIQWPNQNPGIIVAYTVRGQIHSAAFPQKLLRIKQGTIVSQDLPVNISGRHVACHKWVQWVSLYCFFSDYRADSRLIEFRDDGEVVDQTASSKLPFPVTRQGRTHGRFTIGSAFIDINSDGLVDIVSVAQHAYIIVSFHLWQTNKPEFFPGYFEPKGEYLRVHAPSRQRDKEFEGILPSCIYLSMEQGEARRSDYFKCYDQGQWYDLDLAGEEIFMGYREVRFFDHNKDGDIDFMVQNQSGEWLLMTIKEDGN